MMVRSRLVAGLLACLGVMVSARAALSAPGRTSSPGAARGRAVYMAKGCFECHGYIGQGSIMTGPALAPVKLPFERFAAYVRTPAGVMPSYSPKILSAAELADVFTYLRALAPPPAASSIPLLRGLLAPASVRSGAVGPAPSAAQPAGTAVALYLRHCAACHGQNREGGIAPALAGATGKHNAAETAAAIRNPPPGMPQLYPTPLGEEEVRLVAAFVGQER